MSQPPNLDRFIVTDVGSTTTKAILFSKKDRWSYHRHEAPTTVERPHEDVMIGVGEALRGLADETGIELIRDGRPQLPYYSTSSAGGGLAMIVTGLVREVTSRSAERVALGAGAILLDVIAMDDGRAPYERIDALKRLRPDMILLAGGFDGDAISAPVFLAELIRESGLRPKLSSNAKLPVVYAGNVHARDFVRDTLGDRFLFHPIDNIRPSSVRENLEPAREAIHEIFMEHVMSQAPGYDDLTHWVSAPVRPTPAAFGRILAAASQEMDSYLLAIDIGGATTDVFSARAGKVLRTVSANLGMSYSALNVARKGGIDAIQELIADEEFAGGDPQIRLWDEIGGKYLRPTRLPMTRLQTRIEWALAAVAIREAVRDHLRVLHGIGMSRDVEELRIRRFFSGRKRQAKGTGPLRLSGYDLVIGSGGILSHSPREAAAMILIEALRPEAELELAVDSAFMFPHLGLLTEIDKSLALEIFHELGLVRLGAFLPEHSAGKAFTLQADPPAPDGREGPRQPSVERRTLRLRRELAVPGEIFVKAGEQMASDTLIARSRRLFLRPFFLEVASRLGLPPGNVEPFLLKSVGDEIEVDDIIAERKINPIHKKRFLSPVEGKIERILPDGTLVVRERSELGQPLTPVHVAQDLKLRPDQIKPHIRVKEGDRVERGQWLAARWRSSSDHITSPSPVRGRVKSINHAYGVISIEPLLETLDVLAWMPGQVVEVNDLGAIVEGKAVRITGAWGCGGETTGPLRRGDPERGCLLVRPVADRADLERAAADGVRALITGSVHLADVLAVDPGYTLIVTEGFGDTPLAPEIERVFDAHEGAFALADGRTELRVGVRRPVLILPQS